MHAATPPSNHPLPQTLLAGLLATAAGVCHGIPVFWYLACGAWGGPGGSQACLADLLAAAVRPRLCSAFPSV